MATFPFGNSKFHQDSERTEDDGTELDVSEATTVRGRVRFGGILTQLDLVFDPMSEADYQTLRTFRINNGPGPHSITYESTVYTNMFMTTFPKKVTNYADSGFFRVEQRLIGTE